MVWSHQTACPVCIHEFLIRSQIETHGLFRIAFGHRLLYGVCPSVTDAHYAKTVQDRGEQLCAQKSNKNVGVDLSIGTMLNLIH